MQQICNPKTLSEAFEKQVERTPDHPAVSFEATCLSYAELNRRANQWANHLLREINLEEPVAVCMERSIEMVVALYAIIKAGGAYVPMEPDHPEERLAFMAKDTGARIILTQRRFSDKLGNTGDLVVCMDDPAQIPHDAPTHNPEHRAGPDNLAYIIYTSGSTGNPKGAMNEHRGIVNRLLWMQKEFRLTTDDKILQKTPYTFDVSVWEFFWPLQVGAQLVVAKPKGHMDNAFLARTIQEHGITTIHFVPSMLSHFLNERNAANCRSLKRVVCSGEALRANHKKRFYEVVGGARLYNLYGPTEAAVDVTSYFCDPNIQEEAIPIGKPIDNTFIHILDERMQPVEDGETGEIYIGGIQVARGYINRPELTRGKFLPDPFSADANARLYKSGDLGRRRPDGNIEYLGRSDFQVKIRGIRVELEEIETTISQREEIQDCVVVLWTDQDGERWLVAYFSTRTGITGEQLKNDLKQHLPDFMIPEHFIRLPAMPLTSNGKIDRKALPPPQFKRALASAAMRPTNVDEVRITAIWKNILQLDEVGIDDSFFDLGGNSFLLIRVLDELQKHYGEKVSLMSLFSYPTIRKLCGHLDSINKKTATT